MLHQAARDYDDIAEDLEGGAIEIRHPELMPATAPIGIVTVAAPIHGALAGGKDRTLPRDRTQGDCRSAWRRRRHGLGQGVLGPLPLPPQRARIVAQIG